MPRVPLALGCVLLAAGAAWVGAGRPPAPAGWGEVVYTADGVEVRRLGIAYRVAAGGKVIQIDAPAGSVAGTDPDAVLLTHHHRDTAEAAAEFVRRKVPVRAPVASEPWLSRAGVTKFWAESVPLRDSRTAYFVVPEGFAGITFDLKDGTAVPLGEWKLTAVPTPGHSRDHTAFALVPAAGGSLVFCGDAVTGTGKLWTPFTTDWDHWTDAGLTPAAESLRTLAKHRPVVLFPARGPVVKQNPAKRLETAAVAVKEAAFLKSFERFTNRLGAVPRYDFLVPKEQVGSGGDKPWSKVSDHLWLTGNTYVLAAKEGTGCLVLDPWGKRSVEQVEKLRAAEKLGPVEVVAFSHAHYDHFDGVYDLPGREGYQVWALDRVAGPLKDPFRFRAPFLDRRPIRFEKEFADGDSAAWRGYTFRFRHFPGQTVFTSAIEVTIDAKRCVFTADNFFHQAQYSGSGGWTGLNRALPTGYAASAKLLLGLAPEWVLAEHGGPYVFDAEDYRRRVRWGEAAATAADAVSATGDHRNDWDPHRVAVEPTRVRAKPGAIFSVTLYAAAGVTARLDGRGVVPDQTATTFPAKLSIAMPKDLSAGRHAFAVRAVDKAGAEVADPFLAVDVEP